MWTELAELVNTGLEVDHRKECKHKWLPGYWLEQWGVEAEEGNGDPGPKVGRRGWLTGEEAITGPVRERRAGIITLVPLMSSFKSTSECRGRGCPMPSSGTALVLSGLRFHKSQLHCRERQPLAPGHMQVSMSLRTPAVTELKGFAD